MTTPRTYRIEAVTLKATTFAERDRLLILYSPSEGKLRAVAKGVRRTTSKLAGHVGLLSHAALFLVHGRTFDLVTQGQTIEAFPLLHQDLWRAGYAFYVAELMDRFTEERQANPGLFEALLGVLRHLNDPDQDAALCVRAFELDLLALVGYRPQLYHCVACSQPIEPAENSFSPADGGVLCPSCSARPTAAPISVEALRILRNLQTRPQEIVGRVRVSRDTLDQAEHVLIGYIQYLLDVRVRSNQFIEVLRRLRSAQERSGVLG